MFKTFVSMDTIASDAIVFQYNFTSTRARPVIPIYLIPDTRPKLDLFSFQSYKLARTIKSQKLYISVLQLPITNIDFMDKNSFWWNMIFSYNWSFNNMQPTAG